MTFGLGSWTGGPSALLRALSGSTYWGNGKDRSDCSFANTKGFNFRPGNKLRP